MGNALTPLSPKFWSKIMGRKVFKFTVYKSIGSSAEKATLKIGNIVDRPYRANLFAEDYVKGTAATAQDLTTTSDTLTINKQKTILMFVDDIDKIQNKWDAAKAFASDAGEKLAISIDAEFLYEVFVANNDIDDGDFSGGTAGNPLAVTVSNIVQVFAKINKELDRNNVDMERRRRFLVISPQIFETLWLAIQGRETLLGDKTGEHGNLGKYAGLSLFMSNNLTASAIWTPADNPTTAATITVNGVTFTFIDTIGTTAGNILQTSSLAATIDNLVALINAGGVGDGVLSVSLAIADRRTVQEWVAVDGATFITIRAKGASYMTVSTSESADVWSKHTQHMLAGVKGSIDIVVQREPDTAMDSTVSNGIRGMNIMPLTVFGVKTFNQGANELVEINVDTVDSTGF